MEPLPAPPRPEAERLLRRAVAGAAAALVVVGGWMAWEALHRPDVGASFYGKGRAYTPSYWGPFLAFCLVALGFVVYIFARALRRLRAGELRPEGRRVGEPR
ncbi:MAG: hypothetical protein LCH53_13520 [Bacteroidetes bacterium]|nr:hypothetical protein [Bacteroidota bacterium]